MLACGELQARRMSVKLRVEMYHSGDFYYE